MTTPYNEEIDPYLNQINKEAREAGIEYKSLTLIKTMSFEDFEQYSPQTQKYCLTISETKTMIIFKHGNDFSIYYKTENYWIHAFTSNFQIV